MEERGKKKKKVREMASDFHSHPVDVFHVTTRGLLVNADTLVTKPVVLHEIVTALITDCL